ncbi:unnamed protein product, partial [Arabidopsis halleri]
MAAISLELESLLEASYRHIKLTPLKSWKKELLHSVKTQVWSDKTQFGFLSRFSHLPDIFPEFFDVGFQKSDDGSNGKKSDDRSSGKKNDDGSSGEKNDDGSSSKKSNDDFKRNEDP